MISVLLLTSYVLASSDSEYQARLKNLKESQAQTQGYLNKILGFSQPSNSNEEDEKEATEKRRPLFRIHNDLKKNRIKAGSTFSAYNLNRILLSGDSTPAILEINDSQGALSGLRIIAQAKASSVDGRIQIEMGRLILTSGRTVSVQAVAFDLSGAQGLPAQVFSGKALAVAGSIASSFVAGVAASKQTQNTNAFGFTQNQPTGRNAILGGIAQTAMDQSKRLIDEATAEKPILLLDERTPLVVFFNEEVRF